MLLVLDSYSGKVFLISSRSILVYCLSLSIVDLIGHVN